MTNFAFAAQACRDLGITSAMIVEEVKAANRLGLHASAKLVGTLAEEVAKLEGEYRADHVVVVDRKGNLVARCNDPGMAERIAYHLNREERTQDHGFGN